MIVSLPILLLAGLATAQVRNKGNGVQFIFPNEDGLSVNFLDTVNISYTSPFSTPLLYTFCYNVSNHKQLIQTSLIDAKPYNASHLFTLTYPNVSGCYWNLRPNTSTGYGANSFDILILPEGKKSATTIGVGSPAATGTTNTSSTTSNSTSIASPSSTETGTGSPNGLGTGAKAGTSVGGVLAIIAIAALVFWLLKRRRNRKRAVHEKSVDGDSAGNGHEQQVVGNPYGYQHVRPEETGYVGAGAKPGNGGEGSGIAKVTELGAGHSYYGGKEGVVEAGSGEKKVNELPAGGFVPQQPQGEVYEMGDGGRR